MRLIKPMLDINPQTCAFVVNAIHQWRPPLSTPVRTGLGIRLLRLVPSRYLSVFWGERRLGIRLRRARGLNESGYFLPLPYIKETEIAVGKSNGLHRFVWEASGNNSRVACRSPKMSNFIVSFLCTRFPPRWFVTPAGISPRRRNPEEALK